MGKYIYHISPVTGMPGVCYATRGKCPYGGTTGLSNHYNTLEEAQIVADSRAAERYAEFHRAEQEASSINFDSGVKYAYLEGLSEQEITTTITETTDPELLDEVINGEILGDTEDMRFVAPALRNSYISEDTMDDIMVNPEDYTHETLLAFEDNPMLEPEGRALLVRGDLDDDNFCQKICNHPEIDAETITRMLGELRNGNPRKYPGRVVNLMYNPNCPEEARAPFYNIDLMNFVLNEYDK